MKKKAQPILTMRVYPERKSLYFVVNVWRTKREMKEHCVWFRGDFAALCSSWERIEFRKRRWRKTPELGEVNFYLKRMSARIIAHEFTHAVLGWARRVNMNPSHLFVGEDGSNVHPQEERFCHAHDEMVNQFVTKAYAVGIC